MKLLIDNQLPAVLARALVAHGIEASHVLANRPGDAGRLIWVRTGNCGSGVLVERFLAHLPALQTAFERGERIVEIR